MMTIFLMAVGILFLSVVVSSTQTQSFTGKWRFDTERNKPILGSVLVGFNISQNEKQLKIERISTGNGSEEIFTDTYNLGGKETISYIENELEKSTMTSKLEMQDNKLSINTIRLLDDGKRIGTIEYISNWELMDNSKTLKVSNSMNMTMPDEPQTSDTPVIVVYYSKI